MAKIIQILELKDGSFFGLCDQGVVYQCISGIWDEAIPPLSRKKADKSVTLTGQAPVKRFQPPTTDLVAILMKEKGLSNQEAYEQSDMFCNHYNSNGWMVGKNKMKSWPAAVANWLKRYKPTSSIDNDSTDWYQDVERML